MQSEKNDWSLEQHSGTIDAINLLAGVEGYESLLGVVTSSSANETLSDSVDDDTFIFSEGWGSDTIAGAGGSDTLDFSNVAADLTFTVADNGSIKVKYSNDNQGTDSLNVTAVAGQKFTLKGGKGQNTFNVATLETVAGIVGNDAQDIIDFSGSAVVGLTSSADDVLIDSKITASNIEVFSGHISLGASAIDATKAAFGKWNDIAEGYLDSAALKQKIPLLDKDLATLVKEAFQQTGVDSPTDLASLIGLDTAEIDAAITTASADLDALTDLGKLAEELQNKLNEAINAIKFSVNVAIYDWSELRFDILYSASETVSLSPSLSSDITDQLTQAGFDLSFSSNVDLNISFSGKVSAGLLLRNSDDLASGTVLPEDTFLQVSPFDIRAEATVTDLQASAGLSPQVFGEGSSAAIGVDDGTLNLSVNARLELNESLYGSDGRIRVTDIGKDSTPVSEQINASVQGVLAATLPLETKLGSLDLSKYGSPSLLISTDQLFSITSDSNIISTNTPDVLLDIALSEDLQNKITTLLNEVDNAGNGALDNELFKSDIPGLNKSLNDILALPQQPVFKLATAAESYFADKSITITLNGLAKHLQGQIAKYFSIPFDTIRLDWSNADLSGYVFKVTDDLRRIDFSGADLRGATFTGIDLTGVNFSGADLTGAIFDGQTNLRGVNFDGAILRDINWGAVDLRGVNFTGAFLSGADFSGRDLAGTTFRDADLRKANLSGANLRFADFSFADLSGANLSKVLALDTKWDRVSSDSSTELSGLVTNINLRNIFGANLPDDIKQLISGLKLTLENYTWDGFDLSKIDFSNVTFSNVSMKKVNLNGTTFTGASFTGTDSSTSTGTSVNLADAFTLNVTWQTGFTTPDLPHLKGYSFKGWDLSGIDFSVLDDLDFSGTDFSFANLNGVSFGNATFNEETRFNYSRWNNAGFGTLTSGLKGSFRGVDFTGFDFSQISSWGIKSDYLPDFSGIKLAGAVKVENFLASIYTEQQALSSDSKNKINFDFADFKNIDLRTVNWVSLLDDVDADLPRLFQGGEFRGVDFSGMKLPVLEGKAFDFSGINLSGATFSPSQSGTNEPTFKFDSANLRGVDFSGIGDAIDSAKSAFYDAATGFGGVDISDLDMDEVVLANVFDEPLSGSAFAATPFFDFSGNEIRIGFNLQSNLEQQLSKAFSFGMADLGTAAEAAFDTFDISGTAAGKLLLALDIDAGIAIATQSGEVPVLGTLPLPDNAGLFFTLNRLDIGAAVDIYGLDATTTPKGGLAGASLKESDIGLKVAVSIAAEDPDNSDNLGRITVADLQALSGQGKSVSSIFSFTPAGSLDGSFTFDAAGATNFANDWGDPILTVSSSIIEGNLIPNYYFDVLIESASVRTNLEKLLGGLESIGATVDDLSVLNAQLPFMKTSLGKIMEAEDGRTLGDVMSFQHAGGSVLDDYYAKTSGTNDSTYSGLIRQLQDYLAAAGDYADMQSLFPEQYGEKTAGPFTVGGGLDFNTSEIQIVQITDASNGDFTLKLDGEKTSAIALNATVDDVKAALETLTGIGAGNVEVTGKKGYYVIAFVGASSGKNIKTLEIVSNLQGPNGVINITDARTEREGGSVELRLDLGLNLHKLVSLPFSLPADFEQLGIDLQGAGEISLSADVVFDLSLGLNASDPSGITDDAVFVQAHEISATATAELPNFTTGVSIGVLDAEVDNGLIKFEALAGVGLNPDKDTNKNGERVSLAAINAAKASSEGVGSLLDVTSGVYAVADLPLTANLFGGDLTKLTGGENPKILAQWGAEDNLIGLDQIASTAPTIVKQNFSNLASLSNMTPAQMVQLMVNVGDFLNQFRDSEIFDVEIPFTDSDLGDAFDFSYGWTKMLNERLQGILSMELTADNAISPVLTDDVAFDLALKPKGDAGFTTYTVTILKEETADFTSIDQLADLIGLKIAQVANGALQYEDSLPGWVSDVTEDTTSNKAITGPAATTEETSKGGDPLSSVLVLDIGASLGILTLSYNNVTQSLELGADQTNESIIESLTEKVAKLVDSSESNIKVTGSRNEGFRIEFTGNLSGRGYEAETTAKGLLKTDSASVFDLQIGDRSGELVLSYGDSYYPVSLAANDTVQTLTDKITALFKTATDKDVAVSGNRLDGFRVEVKSGTLSDISAQMQVQGEHSISVSIAGTTPQATVSETAAATQGSSEKKVLSLVGFKTGGKFTLSYNGQTTVPIKYLENDITNQQKRIQAALEALPSIGKGNVKVAFPNIDPLKEQSKEKITTNYGTAPRYTILFTGDLVKQNIGTLSVNASAMKTGATVPSKGGYVAGAKVYDYLQGTDASGEQQLISVIAAQGQNASFKLSFTHGTKTYITEQLNSNSTATDVRDALLDASSNGTLLKNLEVGGKKITLSVLSPGDSNWKVTFGGGLAGVDVANIELLNLLDAQTPDASLNTVQKGGLNVEVQTITLGISSGQFRVQLGQSGTLSDNFTATASAAELQALLDSLPEIGKGNVKVSGEPQNWIVTFTGKLSGKDMDTLLVSPVQELTINTSDLQSIKVKFSGTTTDFSALEAISFMASMDSESQRQALENAIAALDGVGAGNVGVVAGKDPGSWEVVFKGALAGKTIDALALELTTQTGTEEVISQTVLASIIQVTATDHQTKGGLTWGRLSLKPLDLEQFEDFVLMPTSGVMAEALEYGGGGKDAVQRLLVVHAGGGTGNSRYTLTLEHNGQTYTTGYLNHDADANAVEVALNAALGDGSVTVDSVTEGISEGVRGFDVSFGENFSNVDVSALQGGFSGLRATPAAQGVVTTLRQGDAGSDTQVAFNEVQRLTFENAAGGSYQLGFIMTGYFITPMLKIR